MSIRFFLSLLVFVLVAGSIPSTPQVSAQVVGPQIAFSGNGQPIAHGDSTPRLEDGTDFGSTPEGTPVQRIFMIGNQGNADLHITALSAPAGFSISLISPASLPATVVPNGSAFINVSCLAEKSETYTDFISVESDDADSGRAGFAVACRVDAQPELDVAGNTIPIANGDTTPGLADATDFGSTAEDAPVTQVFTISNRGAGDLTIGAISVPTGFSLLNTPVSLIPAGGAADLQIRCNARDPGAFSGRVRIESNDADEASFRFTIRCLVQGDDEPTFNPSPGDLPPVDPTVAPIRVTPPPRGGSSSGGDNPGPTQGGSNVGGDSGTQIPSAPAPLATPTAVPTARAAAPPQANTGGTQSNVRPPSTGDGGLAGNSAALLPGSLLVATSFAVGLMVTLRRKLG